MDQNWFEMSEIRSRNLNKSVWIPLRVSNTLEKIGEYGRVGYKEEFFGVGSLAVFTKHKELARDLGWSEIGLGCYHSTYVDDGIYISSNTYVDFDGNTIGEHLVIEQSFNSLENDEWHLSQDFVIALGLKREGDTWVRPDEGYIEVAKVYRREDESPYMLEVRASYLKDYLCAQKMTLLISSYRERVGVIKDAQHILWEQGRLSEVTESAHWEGMVQEIHEGGMPYGEKTAMFHFGRIDVDEEVDVPEFDFPTDDVLESKSWTKNDKGKKLFRVIGELWSTEWIEASSLSPIICQDSIPSNVYFITDAEGTMENRDTLLKGSRWLWFKPEVISVLLNYRGGDLVWYTKDTGAVGCSPDYKVHFGVNKIGLVNVYAKDIGQLPIWQQKIWAGFNLSPDGKVSAELLSSQMRSIPAETQAPEEFFAKGLEMIDKYAKLELGIEIIRNHDIIPELLKKTHRFRAYNKDGLYSLAKDVARLTVDSINTKMIQNIVKPPKGNDWGSIKSLENLIAKKVGATKARNIMSSIVGVYELRHGDAHLPSNKIDEAFKLLNIDIKIPYVHQGYQLLDACTISLHAIASILKHWNQIE